MAGQNNSDLVRSLLKNASEPQTTRSRAVNQQQKLKNTKETRGAGAKAANPASKAKIKANVAPADPAQLERLFRAVENTVFLPRPQPPPPAAALDPAEQGIALIDRLRIELNSEDSAVLGSPMSIERPQRRPAGGTSGPSPLGAGPFNSTDPPSPAPPEAELPAIQHLSAHQAPTTPVDPELLYRQRCSAESDAVLSSCPGHLSHVDQTYLKQVSAFMLADQCNAGLPLLPGPEIVLSAVRDMPRKPTPGVSGPAGGAGRVKRGDELLSVQGNEVHKVLGGADVDMLSVPKPHAPFHFSLEDYNDGGMAGSAAAQAEGKEEEENEKKRARSEAENVKKLQEMREKYVAALAQHNGSSGALVSERECGGSDTAAAAAGGTGAGAPHGGPVPTALPSESPQLDQSFNLKLREEAIRVFCVERANERSGAFYRTFVATSYASVWRAYVNAQRPGSLHWYEVVREGRPCHLYFDLEYPRSQELNSQVDGDALVIVLLGHVRALLARNWGLMVDLERHVYELDSSTTEKFSRHVIVRLPGYAFLNNGAMGHFVAQVVAAAGAELEVAKAPPPSTERTCFVDNAVYTKNRHFRIVYSSKGGKTAVLKPTTRFATGAIGHLERCSPAKVFYDTLICNVDPGVKLLAVLPPLGASSGGTLGTGMSGFGSSGGGAVWHGEVVGRAVTWKRDDRDAKNGGNNADESARALKKLAESAVSFIEKAATRRAGQDARARTVAFCGNEGLVAYSMIGPGSHFCEHIGRDHKNNHVYFVANFLNGTYAQKCHDPDCSRFRSAWMPLPKGFCLPTQKPPEEQ